MSRDLEVGGAGTEIIFLGGGGWSYNTKFLIFLWNTEGSRKSDAKQSVAFFSSSILWENSNALFSVEEGSCRLTA
jgi:hypothetical protein